jgi:hypothetical protein
MDKMTELGQELATVSQCIDAIAISNYTMRRIYQPVAGGMSPTFQLLLAWRSEAFVRYKELGGQAKNISDLVSWGSDELSDLAKSEMHHASYAKSAAVTFYGRSLAKEMVSHLAERGLETQGSNTDGII